mmetsp:Transcript_10049/g.18113  ORF Transcript_10049/g.18113 Transcript_10049/m.18113 type:complete len:241 (+) Transcript_10049:99-821(+)
MGPILAHSAATSSFSSAANVGSAFSSSNVNMCFRITVTSSAFFTSSQPFQSNRFSWFTTTFFLCFLFACFFFGWWPVFCWNFATVTDNGGPPGRSGAPSSMVQAMSTLGSFRKVTSPSPLSIPVAVSRYSFIRGVRSSFSLMMPHFPKASCTSSIVTSPGSPVTYTLLFFFSSNHVSSFFLFSLAASFALAIFSFSFSIASARCRFWPVRGSASFSSAAFAWRTVGILSSSGWYIMSSRL